MDRWYDKAYALLVYENSKTASLLEHTPCDAPIIGGVVNETAIRVKKEAAPVLLIRPLSKCPLPPPTKFTWHLTPSQRVQLQSAHETHAHLASQMDYKMVLYHDYGTEYVRKHGVSPDTFMQMTLQLAYWKFYKKTPPTYESAHTRMFYHGRTECVRTQSVEMNDFVKAMGCPNTSLSTKYHLMKHAEQGHLKYMSDAVDGYGCDRHFFGLKIIHQQQIGGELPEIFRDKAFAEGLHHRLSTSNVPSVSFFGGFGNVVEDGYGCCYINKANALEVSIASSKVCEATSSQRFHDALVETFNEMKPLLLFFEQKKGGSKL